MPNFHICFSAFFLILLPIIQANPLPELALDARADTLLGEINITAFPSCAKTDCISSNLLLPSRLGCTSGTLTKDCLCNVAPAPLTCYPQGPSDEDNCWFELEDWFSTTCNGSIPTVDMKSEPKCAQTCIRNYLANKGCPTQSRNCFCVLPREDLLNATTSCMTSSCSGIFSTFAPTTWRDSICATGEAPIDQTAYENAKKAYDGKKDYFWKVTTAVSVLISLIALVFVIGAIASCINDEPEFGISVFIIVGIVLIVVLVPLFVAWPKNLYDYTDTHLDELLITK